MSHIAVACVARHKEIFVFLFNKLEGKPSGCLSPRILSDLYHSAAGAAAWEIFQFMHNYLERDLDSVVKLI